MSLNIPNVEMDVMVYFRDAWKSIGSMDQGVAKKEYIDLVTKVEPEWHLKVSITFDLDLFPTFVMQTLL